MGFGAGRVGRGWHDGGVRMTGRRWWVAAAVVWGLALVVAAAWSAHHDRATVRGQSSLEQGHQTVDEAVVTLQAAAGAYVGVDVRPYELTPGCQLTLAWRGTELDQVVALTVPAGQEPALLDKLVERLPAEWGARHDPNRSRLVADAGDFVAVRGEVTEPGQVHVTLSTGCRPGTDSELGQSRQ